MPSPATKKGVVREQPVSQAQVKIDSDSVTADKGGERVEALDYTRLPVELDRRLVHSRFLSTNACMSWTLTTSNGGAW